MFLALACLSLIIWVVLICARGGFWRVSAPAPAPTPAEWPDVTAIVPARDEAEVIGSAIAGLMKQDYPGRLDIILVDDHSSDATSAVAMTAASASNQPDRLTIVAASSLPAGWTGKVWAQSEGMKALEQRMQPASFVWLTDADIAHEPAVLRELVARAIAEERDLTSLMVRLRCQSIPERVLIPAFVFFFAMLYPFRWVGDRGRRTAAAAGGCMLVRRSALARIGGLARIRDALIDDCTLAAAIKEGGSIRLDLAFESVSLRPYDSWRSIWMMIARSAFTQLRYSALLLLGTCAGMALTFFVPPVLALGASPVAWPAFAAWLLMALAYTPMLRYYKVPLVYAPALPLVAVFYLLATLDSARRYWTGSGGQWKGRIQAQRD